MSQEDVEVAEEQWRERANEQTHMGVESTVDEVQNEGKWKQEAPS